MDRSKADDLEARLVDFAVRIIHLPEKVPKTPSGRLFFFKITNHKSPITDNKFRRLEAKQASLRTICYL